MHLLVFLSSYISLPRHDRKRFASAIVARAPFRDFARERLWEAAICMKSHGICLRLVAMAALGIAIPQRRWKRILNSALVTTIGALIDRAVSIGIYVLRQCYLYEFLEIPGLK